MQAAQALSLCCMSIDIIDCSLFIGNWQSDFLLIKTPAKTPALWHVPKNKSKHGNCHQSLFLSPMVTLTVPEKKIQKNCIHEICVALRTISFKKQFKATEVVNIRVILIQSKMLSST